MTAADLHGRRRPLSPGHRAVMVAGIAVAIAVYPVLDRWGRRHLFLINTTNSLPNWAFLVNRDARPARGDLVFFAAPDSALLHRHFGAHPAPFGKIVYGVAGDRITRQDRMFLVNGVPVARAKRRSLRGERLEPGPSGVLPRGCLFVATPHTNSFDSRYAEIGWICRERILGVGTPIL